MSDIEFINGLMAKQPNENAPDFVKASISIKREELIAWLSSRNDEWINADIKESRGGKWYVAVNDRNARSGGGKQGRPAQNNSSFEDDEPLPF
jgi:hypothetical protein